MTRILLSTPHMGKEERELLLNAFDSNWVAPLGPHVDGFEREIAEYIGVQHAAALSSGTAALHLALIIAGVQRDDHVWTSTLTFAATANAITYLGAIPTFVDSEKRSWNMDPDLLEEALIKANKENRLPKALVVVDLYGQCADYDRIEALCERYEITLIEDAAEALGAIYRNKKAGSFGRMAILSFNGNKMITCGGGGMLVSNRPEDVERARFLATQARDPAPHYQHSHIGYNYRLSNILAAIGRGQLQHIEDRVAARRAHFNAYHDALHKIEGLDFMPEPNWEKSRSNRWLTCIQIDPTIFGASANDLRLHLDQNEIEARPVWKPMHLQPIFENYPRIGGDVAKELFEYGLCLPSGSNMSAADRQRIIEAIRTMPRKPCA